MDCAALQPAYRVCSIVQTAGARLYPTLANDSLVSLDRITFLTAVTIVKCGFCQPSSTGSTLILSGPLLLRALRMAAVSLTA